MANHAVQPIYLKDYTPPPFLIDSVNLVFELEPVRTIVTSTIQVRRNTTSQSASNDILLNGEKLKLRTVTLDGIELSSSDWSLNDTSLTIHDVPDQFSLTVETEIDPQSNKALEGLYISGERFCTQCEAEGFRRITYYPDRPDVLAKFTVKIVADAERYPVLLSNGNCVDQGIEDTKRHYTVWEDPFPKPCYLFALVAGDLGKVTDSYRTVTGTDVSLNIYVEHGKEEKALYAMNSLKRAMSWDERVFGLEYDLNEFNIVAVSDFNMGAMENKSLNIFNDKFILADHNTATDTDYAWIESVVAHEYFHNWTGNRVTCRDWFQLSLKEGLTVFRDQQFSADERSAAVQRIEDIRRLRATQFTEDAGPLAHPVRPDRYVEINNFYTHTVYEKGAEVVRMIHSLLGEKKFRNGMDLYFGRHDGQAVRCEDFVKAMADSSGINLDQFLLWYSQAGTPEIHVVSGVDETTGRYKVSLRQTCPPTPGQTKKEPMHIPICLGLINKDTGSLKSIIAGSNDEAQETHTVSIHDEETEIFFKEIGADSDSLVLSVNRGFSAPIIVRQKHNIVDLSHLVRSEPDPISRWNASQELASAVLIRKCHNKDVSKLISVLIDSIAETLKQSSNDPALTSLLIELPNQKVLSDQLNPIEPERIYVARRWVKSEIGTALFGEFENVYRDCATERPYSPDAKSAGLRSLRNSALNYLVARDTGSDHELAYKHYCDAQNMTDRLAGLQSLNQTNSEFRRIALDDFARDFRGDELVLDKWFTLEASHQSASALARVKHLLTHQNYDGKNPNRIRALVGAFASENHIAFHSVSGSGYEFLASQILLVDKFNPQTAARLAIAFQRWAGFENTRKALMNKELVRISKSEGLSDDVSEIVDKCLKETTRAT